MSQIMSRLGEWEQRCWGATRCLGRNQFFSNHELIVIAGWQCSRHRHLQRANGFYVESATIEVLEWSDTSSWEPIVCLGPGQYHEVPSLVWHRFRVLSSGRVFEHYWPDRGGVVDVNDIERSDEGGRWR